MNGNNPKSLLEKKLLAYVEVYHDSIRDIAESGAKDGGTDRRHIQLSDMHLEFMYHTATDEAIMEGADVYLSIAKKGRQFEIGTDYRLPYPIDDPKTLAEVLVFLKSCTNLRTG